MRIIIFGLGLSLLAEVPVEAQSHGSEQVISETLGHLYVGDPISYGSLTLFPLDNPFVTDHGSYGTVEEALGEGVLQLMEMVPQRQNILLLRASAAQKQFGRLPQPGNPEGGPSVRDQYGGGFLGQVGGGFGGGGGGGLFGQAGGGFRGGGQNRGFGRSFLLPGETLPQGIETPFLGGGTRLAQGDPGEDASLAGGAARPGAPETDRVSLSPVVVARALHTTGLQIPVFCLEEKRSGGVSRIFTPSFTLAPNPVRQAMLGELIPETQQTVWETVREELQQAGTPSLTHALAAVYEPEPFRIAVEEALGYLSQQPVWNGDTVGMAAAVGGRLVGLDVYVNPDLFRRMAPRLIAAHAVQVARGGPAPPPARTDIYAFLKALARARCDPQPAVALGQGFVLRSPVVVGEALVHRGTLIHASGFPARQGR